MTKKFWKLRIKHTILFPAILFVILANSELVFSMDNCYLGVAVSARSFMPKNFQTVLAKYESDLFRGALLKNPRGLLWQEALTSDKPKAAEMVESESILIIEQIRAQGHFSEIAYHFGVICHYLTDLGMPLQYSSVSQQTMVNQEFTELMSLNISRLRIIFNGYDFMAKQKGSFSNLALTMVDDKVVFEKQLMQAFIKVGKVASYKSFDERSVPFGVASIVYSRIINNVVDVWYSIWKTAGGDLTNKPFE